MAKLSLLLRSRRPEAAPLHFPDRVGIPRDLALQREIRDGESVTDCANPTNAVSDPASTVSTKTCQYERDAIFSTSKRRISWRRQGCSAGPGKWRGTVSCGRSRSDGEVGVGSAH
nr:hypothetical protein Iba_chr07dCG2640 [Ipomoea batatas]